MGAFRGKQLPLPGETEQVAERLQYSFTYCCTGRAIIAFPPQWTHGGNPFWPALNSVGFSTLPVIEQHFCQQTEVLFSEMFVEEDNIQRMVYTLCGEIPQVMETSGKTAICQVSLRAARLLCSFHKSVFCIGDLIIGSKCTEEVKTMSDWLNIYGVGIRPMGIRVRKPVAAHLIAGSSTGCQILKFFGEPVFNSCIRMELRDCYMSVLNLKWVDMILCLSRNINCAIELAKNWFSDSRKNDQYTEFYLTVLAKLYQLLAANNAFPSCYVNHSVSTHAYMVEFNRPSWRICFVPY
jgi:hypothetical protein